MADTQLDATLSASEPISGGLSANEGINASLTPDEEVSGMLEVKRTQEIVQAVWGTITGTLSDQTDLQGALDGKADLENGKVPSSQLPSYVDDVLEYASLSAFPATGEAGKIYIALDTNKTYRWSGSTYVEISESLALGETTGTAYEGSKGKANADAIAKAYKTDDSAETDLQDADYIPFYDTSATAKKKSLWSNIKSKLNDLFFRRSENSILGAKNIMPNNLVAETSDVVTYTKNADGSVTIDTAGNASTVTTYCDLIPEEGVAGVWHRLSNYPTLLKCCKEGRTVTLSGSDVSNVRVTLAIRKGTSTQDFEIQCQGNEVSGQLPSDDLDNRLVYYHLRVASGTTLSNKKVYPMIRFASDTDTTFEPFAMTNKELTDAVLQDASDIDAIEAVIPSSASTSNKLTTASDIPDITGKADLVTSATSGDFAGLDANGNLTDSGISANIIPSDASSSNKLATANDIPSLENYVEKSETAGLLKNDGTVDTTQYVSDISGKVDNSVVAPVESGSTASRAYAVGEHFIRDGAFCMAKTAIASGAAFTLNTNYTAGKVADMGKSGWITPIQLTPKTGSEAVSNYGVMRATINKDLGIAFLRWAGNSTVPTLGNYDFILPSEYIPSVSFLVPTKDANYIEVRPADSIVRISLKATAWSGGSVMYPVV